MAAKLVVVGDQSSGKSSLLETLTGLPMERDTELCTRFATQITSRRDAESRVTVTIIPGPDASDEQTRARGIKEPKKPKSLHPLLAHNWIADGARMPRRGVLMLQIVRCICESPSGLLPYYKASCGPPSKSHHGKIVQLLMQTRQGKGGKNWGAF